MQKISIELSGLSLMEIHEIRIHPDLMPHVHINTHINHKSATGLRVRTIDGGLYDATLSFFLGGLTGVAFNLLSSWIYDKYKENRIKKPMINGVEVDIKNITPEEILTIFAKNKHIDPNEDDAE